MASARYGILMEILRTLREDIVFNSEADDNKTPIKPENIFFRKVSIAERDINKGQTMENFPNIIVSCPYEEPFDPTAGEVSHDEYVYRFLIQIIDSDNFDPLSGLQTYWEWQELIVRAFQFKDTWDGVDYFTLGNASSVDVVDERYWLKEEKFKAGVRLSIKHWMNSDSRA